MMEEEQNEDESQEEFNISFESYIKLLKLDVELTNLECVVKSSMADIEKCNKLFDEYYSELK